MRSEKDFVDCVGTVGLASFKFVAPFTSETFTKASFSESPSSVYARQYLHRKRENCLRQPRFVRCYVWASRPTAVLQRILDLSSERIRKFQFIQIYCSSPAKSRRFFSLKKKKKKEPLEGASIATLSGVFSFWRFTAV